MATTLINKPIVITRTSNTVIQPTTQKITLQPGVMTGVDRLAELTDVVHSSNNGVLTFDSTDSLYKVVPADSQIFTPVVGAITLINWSLGGIARVVLTSNTVLQATGIRGKGIIQLVQGTTGNHRVTYSNKFQFGSDLTETILSTTPGMTDYVGVLYNVTTQKYDVAGFVKGYA